MQFTLIHIFNLLQSFCFQTSFDTIAAVLHDDECHLQTDLIGQIKFLPWQQLNDCSMTRPFLCTAKSVACETTLFSVAYQEL